MGLEPIVLQKKEGFIEKFAKTKVGKVLTSPKTTLALAATLATLATAGAAAPAATGALLRKAPAAAATAVKTVAKKAAPKSVAGAVKTVAGAGLVAGLGASGIKKVTKSVFEKGKTGGEIIAGKRSIKDILGIGESEKVLSKENLLKAAKAAGIVGAGALGVAGITSAIKKIKKGRAAKTEAVSVSPQTELGFTEPRPVGLGGIPIVETSPVITSPEASQSTNGVRPINNIIQIAIR